MRLIAGIGLAAALAATAPAFAEEPASAATESERDADPSVDTGGRDATVEESSESAPPKATTRDGPPVYVPPHTGGGAPLLRIGAATRGADASVPMVFTLVPNEIGLTAEAQPVLSWFLADSTARPAEVAVLNPDSDDPIFTARIDGPLSAGVHRTRLTAQGARLETGVTYSWYVALIASDEDRTRDRVAGGGIRRVPRPANLDTRLASAGASHAAHVLASAGLWYDALDAASRRIEASPGNVRARRDRGALLAQVGLAEPARADGVNP